jgi:hypothetical protein
MLPGETFYQLGAETQMYFDMKRQPVSYICDYGIFEGPFAQRAGARLMADLQAARPDVLVLDRYTLADLIKAGNPLAPWIHENYDVPPVNAEWNPCLLCLRRGSAILQRFQEQAEGEHHPAQ